MSFPTPMNPWYVVQRHHWPDHDTEFGEEYCYIEFYVSEVEVPVVDPETTVLRPEQGFTQKRHEAMIFTNLLNAARVAKIEGAEVRALTSRDELSEFRV